ncbi:MAG TPA: metalloregulator ArsR/SmtB family transcription factor [Lachnospiraceae bacterium]
MIKDKTIDLCDAYCIHEDLIKKQTLPPDNTVSKIAGLFKVFGDQTRVRILYSLSQEELCVCDIAEILHMTQSAISHQLRTLKQNQLVKSRRDGKTVYYSLADSHVKTILNQGMEHVEEIHS